jgi:hypothetical protein
LPWGGSGVVLGGIHIIGQWIVATTVDRSVDRLL